MLQTKGHGILPGWIVTTPAYTGRASCPFVSLSIIPNCQQVSEPCRFYDPITYPHQLFIDALCAATGIRFDAAELDAAGERAVNIEKAFNSRLGYRREDDRLCHRWLNEELTEGPGKGWRAGAYLEELKSEYYRWHGWDEATSLPTRAKLEQLDLPDVADVLARDGALA